MHGKSDGYVSQNNNTDTHSSSNNNLITETSSTIIESSNNHCMTTTTRNSLQQQQQLDELMKMMEGEQQKSFNNHTDGGALIDNVSPSSSSPSLPRSKSLSPLHQQQQQQPIQYNNHHSSISSPPMIHHLYKSSSPSPQHPSTTSPPPQLMTTFQSCHCLIEKLLSVLQPSPQSEEQRSFVFNAISNILSELGLKTFLYGSVAFKTYLPDGDIDISVFESKSSLAAASAATITSSSTTITPSTTATADSNNHNNNTTQQHPWYTKVRSAFKAVQESDNPHLVIRDIYFINAEVKLIKCIVNDIPIDMSSNQAGGLSTLCFLQEVDQKIGQDHLFKRSIILMKAWCYYESRILGSHHGLLSTYALTILIMYIFNVCYDEIDSPLKALSYVLQYFCQFDWDNFAISIHGPVSLQSFPNIQAECVEKYAKFDAPPPHIHRTFMPKFMNIVDPLRDYNNLGRSVSKNNHLRIRRALKKGAKSLKSVLSGNVGQSERILTVFFYNTASHFDLVNIDELNRARQNSRSFSEFMMPNNISSPRQSPGRPRSSSHTPRRQIMECMASPPSPNWIKSNKVFDSKLEDCRANLFSATTHKGMNGEVLQFEDKLIEGVVQSTLRVGSMDEMDALPQKDINFARGKGKRRSKSNAHNKPNISSPASTPSTSSSLSSSPSSEFTPEKARKGTNTIPNSPGLGNGGSATATGERKAGGGNGKKKTPAKSRKLRPNTLSDYINLDTVSTTSKNKSRQQKQKTTQKKKNTPSKASKVTS